MGERATNMTRKPDDQEQLMHVDTNSCNKLLGYSSLLLSLNQRSLWFTLDQGPHHILEEANTELAIPLDKDKKRRRQDTGGLCFADPPIPMSLISLNCRGLGNPATVQVLVDFVHKKRPLLLFLMETRANSNKMEIIKNKLGFEGLLTVDSIGLSGGLALLWMHGLDLSIESYLVNHIDANIRLDDSAIVWRFTGFYGCPERNRRRCSWDLLRTLSTQNTLPWITMGDFNDLLCSSEKIGNVPHPQWLFQGFSDGIQISGLMNFYFGGFQFTWEKGRGNPNWVCEKLDRILTNDSWLDLFGEATALKFIEGLPAEQGEKHIMVRRHFDIVIVAAPEE
nr:uncharacterized protein LOC109184723 [Ipomoea batatas]